MCWVGAGDFSLCGRRQIFAVEKFLYQTIHPETELYLRFSIRLLRHITLLSFVMGYLTDELSHGVGQLTKQRGRSYFLGGAVRLMEADGSHVTATVQGSLQYEVEIFVAETFLDASCTCPFYERDFETCKHIWATALAAEQRGYLRDSLDFDGAEVLEAATDSIPPRAKQRAVTVKKPSAPSWQQQLQPVLTAMKAEETGRATRAGRSENSSTSSTFTTRWLMNGSPFKSPNMIER